MDQRLLQAGNNAEASVQPGKLNNFVSLNVVSASGTTQPVRLSSGGVLDGKQTTVKSVQVVPTNIPIVLKKPPGDTNNTKVLPAKINGQLLPLIQTGTTFINASQISTATKSGNSSINQNVFESNKRKSPKTPRRKTPPQKKVVNIVTPNQQNQKLVMLNELQGINMISKHKKMQPQLKQFVDSSSTVSLSSAVTITRPTKSYVNTKARKKDEQNMSQIGPLFATNMPQITIVPVTKTVSVSVNTSTPSSDDKKPSDIIQNRLQSTPTTISELQAVVGVDPSSCRNLLFVMGPNGEKWADLSHKSTPDIQNILKGHVPDETLAVCTSAIQGEDSSSSHIVVGSSKNNNSNNISKKISNCDNKPISSTVQSVIPSTSPNLSNLSETHPHPPSSTADKPPSKLELKKSDQSEMAVINQDEKFVVCDYCGMSSSKLDHCIRCGRKFPPGAKMIEIKNKVMVPQNKTATENNSQILQIMGRIPQLPRKNSTDSNSSSPECPKKKQKLQDRKRRVKIEEPICVTISSDEESSEPDNIENFQNNLNQYITTTKESFKFDPIVTQAAKMKEPVIDEEYNSPHNVMEDKQTDDNDESNQSSALVNISQNISDQLLPPPADFVEHITCRTVRIGSYKVVPTNNVIFEVKGINIFVPPISDPSTTIHVRIPYQSITKVLAHYGRGMPVFFIYTNVAMGAEIRNIFNMTSKDSLYYYDPSSKIENQKRITLLPEKINDDTRIKIKCILGDYHKIHEELSNKEANDILVRASPVEAQNRLKTCSNRIQKILVYPPPPMKNGISINTEDYACLGEDQFLNDVIIDFYLKYLLQTHPQELQDKTHILSTFFYQRLTTKPPLGSRRSINSIEDDPTMSAAEKRHARVKNWTKSVDLFKKDFIIIPINENSHWFLAIICFPGLTGPVRFQDDKPINLQDSNPKNNQSDQAKEDPTNKDLANGLMGGLTSMIYGNTTITAVNATATSAVAPPLNTSTITMEPEEDDRDEADGEDEDWELEASEDDLDIPAEDRFELNERLANNEPIEEIKRELMIKSELLMPQQVVTSLPSSQALTFSIPKTNYQNNRSTCTSKREPIKQPCILIFDSLAGASRAKVVATLRDYIRIEYKVKYGHERDFSKNVLKGACPKVPQQTNFTDCGLYVLQYVEAFFENPITDYHLPIKTLQDWFKPEIVSRKRYDIQQLLHHLMEEQNIDISSLNLPDLNFRMSGSLVDYPDTDPEDMEEECEDEDDLDEEDEMMNYRRLMMARHMGNRQAYDDEDLQDEMEEMEDMEEGELDYLCDFGSDDEEEMQDEDMDCEDDIEDNEHSMKFSYEAIEKQKMDLKSFRIPRLNRDNKSLSENHETGEKN